MKYLIVAACILSLFQAPKPIECPLEQWFKGYNETYFDGKLKSSVTFGNLPDNLMGQTNCEGTNCHIVIANEFKKWEPLYLETLLHEMCHVAAIQSPKGDEFDDHGPRFQACMLRLAEAGAFKGLW